MDVSTLAGSWELNYITGPRIAFEGLYPDKKPTIQFDIAEKRFFGNTSCNSYNGALDAANGKITIPENITLTKMFCPGQGEATFLDILKKVNRYSVEGKTLTLFMDDVAMMRFEKQ